MHFAYPPRKASNPRPYLPRTSRLPGLRRSRLKVIALAGLAFLALVYLVARPSGGRHGAAGRRPPSGSPPAVVVTVLDEKLYSTGYLDAVRENRVQYAEKHGMLPGCAGAVGGYKAFFANVGDYDLDGAPGSWTSVVAMRHALTTFPDCRYVWFLDQNAFIMNPKLKIEDHVMKASKLDGLMKKEFPVVPPDSIIKTFSHLKGKDVDVVFTQDKDGLSTGSFVLRNGEWAKFFLETWFGPIYRAYNFQKAETHALEHIVQWHPTVLAKLAIVDQDVINAYSKKTNGVEYKDGDIAVRLAECAAVGPEACEAEAQSFVQQWRKAFRNS
ncbi:glycosyltransferase family 34 protein [Trichocladium antarcticum]|uniref:Glycosyltransferase family 34 protein n=1 Tax=Trichocladium antarcticum TaxID=1450529 RepID=A0AAN6ZF56_9PEZI|nr:glycosyltransferase family 34 protein [Trichocladium antarcticum]